MTSTGGRVALIGDVGRQDGGRQAPHGRVYGDPEEGYPASGAGSWHWWD